MTHDQKSSLRNRIWKVKEAILRMFRKISNSRRIYLLSGRLKPASKIHGLDRGKPIDRHFIEHFLAAHASDIRGHCLEVRDDRYTVGYGGARVVKSDVLDIDPESKRATIIGDLRQLDAVADETYDCIILTQTLQFIDDVHAALSECQRMLKAGGIILATVPTTSRVDREAGVSGDFWRWSEAGARKTFGDHFPPQKIRTKSYGNVLSTSLSFMGFAAEDLKTKELDYNDLDFPCIIAIRAEK